MNNIYYLKTCYDDKMKSTASCSTIRYYMYLICKDILIVYYIIIIAIHVHNNYTIDTNTLLHVYVCIIYIPCIIITCNWHLYNLL